MTVTVRAVRADAVTLRARIPFRYGIAEMTAMPHVFVRATVDVDGTRAEGVAADNLPPKWFTKDPTTTYAEDLVDLRAAVLAAGGYATGRSGPTVFDWWLRLHRELTGAWAYPPLLTGFAVSLVERAVLDAFCRARRTTIGAALRDGGLGIRLGAVHPELSGVDPAALLGPPRDRVVLRHTVGLTDPLTADDEPAAGGRGEYRPDGLPRTLVECVRAYGVTHLKVKLSGDPDADLARLSRIRAIADEYVGPAFRYTLDGNEQYRSVDPLREFVSALRDELTGPLLFVEQPLHRDVAFDVDLAGWPGRPPIVADESGGTLDALPTALAAGYAGISHKNCKGVFPGVANACLVAARNAAGERRILSAEDLTTVGPVSVQQDLAMVATLGVPHVERNGHHYFRGLSGFPAAVSELTLAAHPDLYAPLPDGTATLSVRDGVLAVGSVLRAPFGTGLTPDVVDRAGCVPLADWQPSDVDD
ncbi:MAG TPA: hypothetical protein VGN37_22110 [Actinocatenispora sp.]